MLVETIKKELEQHIDKADIIKIWYIKEFLQSYILKEIYESENSKDLIFYWWTSLRFLFWLNRLSEDLDFVSNNFTDFELLGVRLQKYFKKNDLELIFKVQKFRVILNFKNLLEKFDLTFWNSKDLYLKIEISNHFDFCEDYKIKIYPVFRFNQALLIKWFDKSTLFSTKLNAVLNRKWEKQIWENKISVKWRDIYDLFWYLSNNFKPNIDCIIDIDSLDELKDKLINIIWNINFKEVIFDIENFIEDKSLLLFLEENWKEVILEKIKDM